MYQSRFSRSPFFRAAVVAGLALVPCLLARGQGSSELRALIVSGGPSLQQNEYAIESNARYLESLTKNAAWRRVHFADGKRTSKTIQAVKSPAREQVLLDWMLDRSSNPRVERRASTLARIDGPSTQTPVLQSVKAFVQGASDTRGLMYFTGHGSPGKAANWLGTRDDYQNTTYALWNGEELSVRELAGALQKWPSTAPLVLVMVQCHAGGFANVMFQGGDPKQPVWNADFAGFFAATAERQSSGCTAEMDERDYHDFTTHFFAALSGRARDGQRAATADYDRNGAVSLNEAFTWASLRDLSIDVPVSTSEIYLRHIYRGPDQAWTQTPYSTVRQSAAPWQRALLDGLSRTLKLSGEQRVATALKNLGVPPKSESDDSGEWWNETRYARESQRYGVLEERLHGRFPNLKTSARQQQAALRWMRTQKADVDLLHRLYQNLMRDNSEVEAALRLRFVRAARTVDLQNRLARAGTPEQKRIFARLRTAEGRNPLK